MTAPDLPWTKLNNNHKCGGYLEVISQLTWDYYGDYDIKLHLSVLPVKHARRKVATAAKEDTDTPGEKYHPAPHRINSMGIFSYIP